MKTNCCSNCLGSYGFGADNWGCLEKRCPCHTEKKDMLGESGDELVFACQKELFAIHSFNTNSALNQQYSILEKYVTKARQEERAKWEKWVTKWNLTTPHHKGGKLSNTALYELESFLP